jgi:hypothetical protein
VAARLKANEQVLARLPSTVTASGDTLSAGAQVGSVLLMPATAQALNDCGFQCVKPQSCVNQRPLACARPVVDGASRTMELSASAESFNGSQLASRSAADSAGEGFQVATASQLWGKPSLVGGHEYWVHNDVSRQQNCWADS